MRILGLLLANGAVLLAAHALLRRVRTGEASTDAVIFLLLRLGVISLAVLAAGVTGLLSPLGLGAAGALGLAALVALGEHRHLPRPGASPAGRAVLAMAALLLVRSLLQVWFFAPFQRDVHSYHLPKLGEWVQHQGFTGEWGLDFRSTFPSGFELIEAWWVVPLHHDVLVEMAGLEFLALGAAATWDLARRLGCAAPAAAMGALLYALTPGLCLQATSCLNDGPVAALWTATAALLLRSVPLTLLLLPLALGVGVKPTFVYALPGLAVIGWGAFRGRSPGTRWTAGIAAGAVVVGLFWYVRNAIAFGNPIHPVNSAGILLQTGHLAQRIGPSPSSLLQNVTRIFSSRIYDHLGPYDPELTNISGWGLAALSVGWIALFHGLRKDPLLRRVAAGYVVSLLAVCALVVSDAWFMRYLLFFPGLFAVASARFLESTRFAAGVLWFALGIQFVGTMFPGGFPIGGGTEIVSQPWRTRSFYPYPMLDGIEEIGFLEKPQDSIKNYSLYRPDFSRRVVHLRAGTADELIELLRRERLRYVFSPKLHPLARECVKTGRLEQIRLGLYRLPSAP